MRHLLAMIITCALIAPAAAQESEEAWYARITEHAGDFDYLLGEWQFTSRGVFGEGGGYWTAVRLPTGDGGFTWERNYMTIEARRVGPPRDLEPLASGAKP